MKNTKVIIGVVIALLIVGGGIYFYWKSTQVVPQTLTTASGQILVVPTRTAEINGTVLRVEGNEVVVNRVVSSLSAEEQAEKKAKMQALTIEERQALKNQETEVAQTEEVIVVIPVGIPIVIGTGDMTGTLSESSLSEIKVGTSLSIWKIDSAIEMVKIKGL